MKPKLTQLTIWTVCIVLFLMSSCSSSKKFDYASAYKFRTIKHSVKSQDEVKTAPENTELLTSTEMVENKEFGEEIEKSQNELLKKVGLINDGEELSKDEVKERFEKLDKKEKRQVRKELLQELKTEMKSVKNMEKSDVTAKAATKDLTGYTRVGVIVGGLGVIVLILGAIFGVGALSVAGAILVLGGVVFILVDVI